MLRLTLIPTACDGSASTADGVSFDEVGAMYVGGGVRAETGRLIRFLTEAWPRLVDRMMPEGAVSLGMQYGIWKGGKVAVPDIPDDALQQAPDPAPGPEEVEPW